MKVSTAEPFDIIYSLFQHEYLGYMFESFVIQLDDKGKLTFLHQNISYRNAEEFVERLDEKDFELIRLIDSMQQETVIKHFHKKKIKPADFFQKYYQKENELKQEIDAYIERRRARVLRLLPGKNVFEMSNDGEPAWKQIDVPHEKATILFHFRKNENNTHYFPTIKHNGEKVEFQYNGAYIICHDPAWIVVKNKLYSFKKGVDGNKLKPFLNKKFIVIPQNMEETYYKKFIAPLVASFDVFAKGFEINTTTFDPRPQITFSELAEVKHQPSLFNGNNNNNGDSNGEGKILFELSFQYGNYTYKADFLTPVSVSVKKEEESYTFHRVRRNLDKEKETLCFLKRNGLELKHARATFSKSKAFHWLKINQEKLLSEGFLLKQNNHNNKRYFLGQSSIKIEVKENIDWFDVHAIIKFGDFEIPFYKLRKFILRKERELILPDGQIAVIPEAWFTEYSEFFAFMDDGSKPGHQLTLKKHHMALVKDLENDNLAKITMSRKLERLKEFDQIEDHPLPILFKGKLRPYQKAGYNWLQFLNKFKFGGCLADDMGLGKTVQTLAMLQAEKEKGKTNASLLIMPTSLVYNWEMEAQKFTPELKMLTYTGTNREKEVAQFEKYDLVLTSYGIARLDIAILKEYNFNYIILDESQAIKNPNSNIAKAVKKLKSRNRLILTGTPLENSTLDLWSQMTFINPGLLGNQTYFKNEFLNPIEKKNDNHKTSKLYTIIKPFILRRHKSQVAKELPDKVESIQYSTMTTMQEDHYEEAKSYFRNKILDKINTEGIKSSQLLLLQGLTKLRQIANHPKMVDLEYKGDSGKLENVTDLLLNAIGNNHNVLIFSQFVKHLSILKHYLETRNIPFSYLDGSTRDRKQEVERFQREDHLKIFLISLKAGGLGLNLTKADYVFILDPWWNPAIEAQAVDRAHRIGQENRVFTYKFISKNTVEEKILALQQKKVRLAQDLITTEESFVKNLSKEDIASLLE